MSKNQSLLYEMVGESERLPRKSPYTRTPSIDKTYARDPLAHLSNGEE